MKADCPVRPFAKDVIGHHMTYICLMVLLQLAGGVVQSGEIAFDGLNICIQPASLGVHKGLARLECW